jgi:hypothetical protein
VIEHAYIDQFQCLAQSFGDAYVGLTGFADTGRVIVGKNDRRRIVGKCLFDHFARLDAGAIDGATKHFAKSNNTISIVQHQTGEDFMVIVAQSRS